MARKPAQTKAEDKTTTAATAAGEKPVPVTGADDTGATGHSDAAAANMPPADAAPMMIGIDMGRDKHPDEGGTATADTTADAPDQDPAADAPGQTGGEVAVDVSADQSPEHAGYAGETGMDIHRTIVAAEGAARAPIIPTGTTLEMINSITAPLPPAFIVICHRQGGRRRAGRRWPHGETPVRLGELTAYDLGILAGDPQFTVTPVTRS